MYDWSEEGERSTMSANCADPGDVRHRNILELHEHAEPASHVGDALHLLDPSPWQADDERVELQLGQRDAAVARKRRPEEAALMQSAGRAPDAEAVVDEQLGPRAASVGEDVAVVRLGGAEHGHDLGEQTVRSGTHVHGLGCEPHGVDADHRSSSRIQAAHSGAAATGQVALMVVDPRRSSMRISNKAGVDGIATETNGGGRLGFGVAASGTARCASASSRPGSFVSNIQRLARLALTPWAMEIAAIETPGWLHAATTCALNSSLCLRRRRPTTVSGSEIVFTSPQRS